MNRPRIICHMATSVDGRILTRRWSPSESGNREELGVEYERVHDLLGGEAWLVGRTTMEEFTSGRPRPGLSTRGIDRQLFVADASARAFAIGLDPSGKLHWGTNRANGNHTIAVVTDQVTDEYLAELKADGVSYINGGKTQIDLRQTLSVLHDVFGVRVLLLEGGGVTNGTFFQEGLVDELSLMLCPAVDGLASSPSLFHSFGDEGGASSRVSLSLRSHEALTGGILWARYTLNWNQGEQP